MEITMKFFRDIWFWISVLLLAFSIWQNIYFTTIGMYFLDEVEEIQTYINNYLYE
jgi:hypothetical protein